MALVLQEVQGAVATLWLNRPEARNALSLALCVELADSVRALAGNESVRVIVIRGKGPVFCAGADFRAVAGADAADFLSVFEDLLEMIDRCSRPTVAVLQGAAMGGGLQLASVCDFRLAERGAKLGIPAAKLGIVVNFENVRRLVLLIGAAKAKELLVAAREVNGSEAAQFGLVTAAVAPETLDDEVESFVARLASRAPLAVQGMKQAIAVVANATADARAATPEDAAGSTLWSERRTPAATSRRGCGR